MGENLEGTSLDQKGLSSETDVDALIAGALKELETKPVHEKALEKQPLKATPIPSPQPSKSEEQKEAQKIQQGKPSETEHAYEETLKDFRVGAVVEGVVAKIDQSGILVDLGYKSDGWINIEEITPNLKVGDKIYAMIEKLESKEGYVILSKSKADFEIKWEEAYNAYKNKVVLEANITSAVKGGLVAEYRGIRGFIPASQVAKNLETPLDEFVGKMLPVKIIEINRRQSKVILSHKLGAIEQEKKGLNKIFQELEVGQVRRGVVKSIKSFGAFIDLGGVEGLAHLSELSWKRVKHPSEVLKVGQDIDVFVLGIDRTNNKISLGLKELQTDPWVIVSQKYKAGQTVKVKVLRLAKFGAFVELEEGIEGLIHISELSKEKVASPDAAVKPGDIVEAKILRIIPEEQKVGLSIREVQIMKEKMLAEEQKKEESKVTIGEMLAEKERQKTEREAEFTDTNEIPPEA